MAFDPFEYIDEYTAGNLSGELLHAFEKVLAGNDKLAAAVNEQREINEAFNKYDPELFNLLDEISASNPSSDETVVQDKRSKTWIGWLVALLILLALAAWYALKQPTATIAKPGSVDSIPTVEDSLYVLINSDSNNISTPQRQPVDSSLIITSTHGKKEDPPPRPSVPFDTASVIVDVFALAKEYARPYGNYYLEELAPSLKGGNYENDSLAVAIRTGDFPGALVLLDESVPENALVLLSRGYLRLCDGRTQSALEDFSDAVKNYPFYATDAQFLKLTALATALPEGKEEYQIQLSLVISAGEPYADQARKLDRALR